MRKRNRLQEDDSDASQQCGSQFSYGDDSDDIAEDVLLVGSDDLTPEEVHRSNLVDQILTNAKVICKIEAHLLAFVHCLARRQLYKLPMVTFSCLERNSQVISRLLVCNPMHSFMTEVSGLAKVIESHQVAIKLMKSSAEEQELLGASTIIHATYDNNALSIYNLTDAYSVESNGFCA